MGQMQVLAGHLYYITALAAAGLMLPPVMWDPQASQFIFVIGFIAIWRYTWGLINWVRFHIYRYITFPKWRAEAERLGDEALPPHMYLLVTSFRIGSETTRRVYLSVMREAIRYDRPTTIVASVVERADQAFIKQMFEMLEPPEHIRLIFVRIAGTGKRDALACGFRAISKQSPAAGSVTAVIDGDSMLTPDSIARCACMFSVMPDLGALTTDESCEVEGKWIFREWYNMRFAQRHIYMSSVSLSRRVLTLTGRMSMFRTDVITSPEFIERVELDWVDHWRLGRFKFLTGDDKSSWYHMVLHAYPMIYVPDVEVITIETPPNESFLRSSLVLMQRWFGNMLRTNGRAAALGPKALNWFPWISTIDQRLSMWTALTGFFAAILASVAITPVAFLYYLWWVAFTRYILTLSLLAARPSVSAFYPFLLYYNQIVGSFVKTVVLFRLDKQKWTRQNTVLRRGQSFFKQRMAAYGSSFMHAFALTLFLAVLATITNIIEPPELAFWHYKLLG